jgi:hypothetical protein
MKASFQSMTLSLPRSALGVTRRPIAAVAGTNHLHPFWVKVLQW